MYITNYPVFFHCYFRSGTEILMAVAAFGFFFQESFLERGLHISMNGKFIFSGDSFLGGEGTPLGLHLLWLWGIHGIRGTSIMPLPTKANRVVIGLKRSMNYNLLWKIYKKSLLTLQENALLHRKIFKTSSISVQHVYLMVDFKPLLHLSRH